MPPNCKRARLWPSLLAACERWLNKSMRLFCSNETHYVGHYLVSSTGEAEWTESPVRVPHRRLTQIPERALCTIDSGTVAMKVGIRQGVCNNSPAEVRGPDNGWRPSLCASLDLYSGRCCVARCKGKVDVAWNSGIRANTPVVKAGPATSKRMTSWSKPKQCVVTRCGFWICADLGCSSSYSIESSDLPSGWWPEWSRIPCQQLLHTGQSVVSQAATRQSLKAIERMDWIGEHEVA